MLRYVLYPCRGCVFAQILGSPDFSVRVLPVAADLFFFTVVLVYGTHADVMHINMETLRRKSGLPDTAKDLQQKFYVLAGGTAFLETQSVFL